MTFKSHQLLDYIRRNEFPKSPEKIVTFDFIFHVSTHTEVYLQGRLKHQTMLNKCLSALWSILGEPWQSMTWRKHTRLFIPRFFVFILKECFWVLTTSMVVPTEWDCRSCKDFVCKDHRPWSFFLQNLKEKISYKFHLFPKTTMK